MAYTIEHGVIRSDDGLPCGPRWFCDNRVAFQADDELGLVLERLYVYAHLKADEDTGNSANRARLTASAQNMPKSAANAPGSSRS